MIGRPIALRFGALALAALVTAAIIGGLSLRAAAHRGDLLVFQWGGER